MEKDPRDIVIENLMKEVKFAMTRDIVTITENLKAFREIRVVSKQNVKLNELHIIIVGENLTLL